MLFRSLGTFIGSYVFKEYLAQSVNLLMAVLGTFYVFTACRMGRSAYNEWRQELAPDKAILLKDGKEIEVSIDSIKEGDVLLIKPGEKIPVDGKIVEGSSFVDQAFLTGESIPVEKSFGDKVFQATINKQGSFKMTAEKVGNETTLSQIIAIVEEGVASKAPIARLADKVAGIFVPAVILIAILTFAIWFLLVHVLRI